MQPLRHRRPESSGLKPLLQKPIFVGAASAATFAPSRTRSSGLPEQLPSRILRHRRPESSGLKPLLQKPIFVGAAFAATFASSKTRSSGLPEQPSLQPLRHRRQRFGAKAPPTKTDFRRSGFRRDPLRHREPGVRGFEAAFTANLAPSKAEVRGESLSDDRRSGGGQRPAVALPGPQGAMGGARWPLPRSDHCRVMSRRTTARGCPAISGHLLGGGRLG